MKKPLKYSLVAAVLWAAAFVSPLLALEQEPVQARLLSEVSSFVPGQAFTVALELKHEEGWHTYWENPGDIGLPTEIEWSLPQGVTASALLWPQPMTFDDPGNLKGYGYSGITHLLTEIKVKNNYKKSGLLIKGKAFWLVCREVCIPGEQTVSLNLPKGDGALSNDAVLFSSIRPSLGLDPAPAAHTNKAGEAAGSAEKNTASLLLMLLFAFLGGLLLNLMPCVLPVLSLKVLSFVEQAGESRKKSITLAGFFAAGVVASFWALAAIVIVLKMAGTEVGWGFQFQNPIFVLLMAAVVTAFALNLFGVFEFALPGGAMQSLSSASSKQGALGAFGQGLFITLLATPCTAPFLGTALGFAFAQSAGLLFLIFTLTAIGLALPYVALAAFPAAHAWIPKPGPWMLRFKEGLGFLLLATLVWLMWVLAKQIGSDSVVFAWIWIVIASFALWVLGWAAGSTVESGRRWMIRLLLAALVAGSGFTILKDELKPRTRSEAVTDEDGWIAYDEKKLSELRQQGRTVFLDFTADWCWTCKVNEVMLKSDAVEAAFKADRVIKMKADWTLRDEKITEKIKSFGRSGVPLYVIYHGQKQWVLPEIITKGIVLEALKKAKSSSD